MRLFVGAVWVGVAAAGLASCSDRWRPEDPDAERVELRTELQGGYLDVWRYERARRLAAQGSDFDKALYHGYIALADGEAGEYDRADTRRFVERARVTAHGLDQPPEDLSARHLPKDKQAELAKARQRLIEARANGARKRAPQDLAAAQISFDCWMQEQEENYQPRDIAKCRKRFQTAMAKAETPPRHAAALPPPRPARPVPPKPAPRADAPKAAPETFLVFFDFESSRLTGAARSVAESAAAAAQRHQGAEIVVVGHTDRAGRDGYNVALSMRRAQAVRRALVRDGLSAGGIAVEARGESDPEVPTPDNVREPRNRRVEIIVR